MRILALILGMLFIILFVSVFLVFGSIGSRLKKNYIAWGFIGLGVMISYPLILSPFIFLFGNPEDRLIYWTTVNFTSPIFSLIVAYIIAYRKGLFKKQMPVA